MNKIVTKAAAEIRSADDDDESPNGAFDVILSAQSLDRDGDTLKSTEWRDLPEHITFDVDHGMNVASTVGSGKPFINEDGNLQVRGTYSSIPRAQEVRTLVNEGHIRTTSVAFLTHKNKKDNTVERELLNGAFVAIPANPDAVVLSSKSIAPSDDGDADDDPGKLAQATDAALDQAIDLLSSVDVDSLPAEVQQAISLIYSADTSVDALLDVLGVSDPDEDAEPAEPSVTDADEKSADVEPSAAPEAAAGTKSADEVELRARALQIELQSFGL